MVILLTQQWKWWRIYKEAGNYMPDSTEGGGWEHQCNMGIPSCEAVVLDVYGGDTGRTEGERQREGWEKWTFTYAEAIMSAHVQCICVCIYIYIHTYISWIVQMQIFTQTQRCFQNISKSTLTFYFPVTCSYLFICLTDYLFICWFLWDRVLLYLWLWISLWPGAQGSACLWNAGIKHVHYHLHFTISYK